MKVSKRILSWLLIAALVNPAWALDTDIYQGITTGSSAAEPNILLILDTSDSMNLPEGWREYPGAYDSHVEYLWNDVNAIASSEVLTETPGMISTGNGYGAKPLSNAQISANTVLIQMPDTAGYSPGATITLTGTPDPALNGTFTILSTTNTNIVIHTPPGVNFNVPATQNVTPLPQLGMLIWTNLGFALDPGAATPAPTMALGFWGGDSPGARRQIWQAALAYAQATEPGDPGPRSVYRSYAVTDPNSGSALYWLPAGTAETDHRLWSNAFNRFLGADRMSRFGSVNGNSDPVIRGGINFGTLPAQYSGYNQCQSSKDSLTPSTVFAPSTQPQNGGKYLGQKWQRYERYRKLDSSLAASYPGPGSYPGNDLKIVSSAFYDGYLSSNRDANDLAASALPILKSGNSSDAGWSNLRPDWGGYRFKDRLWGIPDAQSFNQLLLLYGYPAGAATLNDARIAGNMNLAVPGYYDTPRLQNAGATMLTNTRSCTWTGQVQETDAGNLPRRDPLALSYGGNCSDLGVSCSDPGNPACASILSPAPCLQTLNDNFYTRDNNNCHWINRNALSTMTFSGCHWTGARLPVPLGEGRGNQYYAGGSCVGTCTGASCPAAVDGGTNYCVNAAIPSQQFGDTSYANVLQTTDPTAGCSNRSDNGPVYYYGGSCVGDYRVAPGSANVWPFANVGSNDATNFPCENNTTPSLTVNGAALSDVSTVSSTDGCVDKSDPWQSCADRHGGNCVYQSCANRVSSANVGGSDYNVYDRNADTDNVMVHDCVADEGATGPYMSKSARAFGATWDIASSYETAAAQGIASTLGAAAAVDVYSVNYLNWKFGPKSNGNPIGRKTRLQTTKDAMVQLVQTENGVRFGLMVFNRMDNNHNTEGGNIVYAVQRMGTNVQADIDQMSSEDQAANSAALANRGALIAKINSLVAISQTPLTESLYEAYRYFNGAAPIFGQLATATPDGSKAAAGCDKNAFGNPGNGSDCLGSSGGYHSPMLDLLGSDNLPASCQKNFVLLMTDGGPENDWSANDAIKSLVYQTPGSTNVISPRTDVNTPPASPATAYNQLIYPVGSMAPAGPVDAGSTAHDGGYVWLDELAYFMANSDVSPAGIPDSQPVLTYTIGFAGANSPVLQNAAAAGNGLNLTAGSIDLSSKLIGAVESIRTWTPLSGGAVVPISALNRTDNSGDVYLGFFGPTKNVQWNGTLKKYQLSDVTEPGQTGYCGSQPTLANPSGEAVNLCLTGQTPLVNDLGETVWNIEYVNKTPVAGQFDSKINDSAVSDWIPVAAPDGGNPNKGGSGQVLVSGATPITDPSVRKIYTFIAGVSSSADLSSNPLAESNADITGAVLGNAALTPANRAALINFARGGDPGNGNCSDADPATRCLTWRTWAHADILHSKPAVMNYTSSQAYLFYVSTDGILHAVDQGSGKEVWAFMIEEALPLQSALMANNIGDHLIAADGSPSIFFDDANRDGIVGSGDRVMLYFGQRRGGSTYYALDISDISHPKFAWKIVGGKGVVGAGKFCVGSSACNAAADYDELGQTWSIPAVGKVRALTPTTGSATPVLIFGGGYDPNQDNDPVIQADTMGRAVYVVNGYTGSVIRKFDHGNTVHGMDASFPSDAAALNVDLDPQNLLDRIYIGDTAANLYRFDIDDAVPTKWTGGRIARLSDIYSFPGSPPNRKILFPPTLVKQNFGSRYDAVYVGTGDREHPLKTSGVADKMFMVKDNPSYDPNYLRDASYSGGDLLDIGSVADETAYKALHPENYKGWYYSLAGSGEKVTSSPTVFSQVLRFSSYAPQQVLNACVPSGRGQLYGMNALSGAALDSSLNHMSALNPRMYAGFYSRGYIGSGVPIIYNKRAYILQVTESGSILANGVSGNCTLCKIYWYRETER